MCFDIEVTKLTLEELRDILDRMTLILSKPFIVNNLPDKGYQVHRVKLKLETEIKFRDSLEATRLQMQRLSLRCSSDSDVHTASSHSSRLCSMEKQPGRERFKPHSTLMPSGSGKTESMRELRTGTKLIDLSTSLALQKEQGERVKNELVKSKKVRFMTLITSPSRNSESHTGEKESEGEEALDNNVAQFEADDQPGTSTGWHQYPKRYVMRPTEAKEVAQFETDNHEPGPSQDGAKEPKNLKKVQEAMVVKTEEGAQLDAEPGTSRDKAEETNNVKKIREAVVLKTDEGAQLEAEPGTSRDEAKEPKNVQVQEAVVEKTEERAQFEAEPGTSKDKAEEPKNVKRVQEAVVVKTEGGAQLEAEPGTSRVKAQEPKTVNTDQEAVVVKTEEGAELDAEPGTSLVKAEEPKNVKQVRESTVVKTEEPEKSKKEMQPTTDTTEPNTGAKAPKKLKREPSQPKDY